jgi:ribosomal protein L11 methyltransferase
MPWLQLFLDTTSEDIEICEDALLGAGAACVTLLDAANQPVLEPAPGETPLWKNIRLVGLFDANTDMNKVSTYLCETLNMDSLPGLSIEPLEDRDWTRAWMDNFKPMSFGSRLWICPEGFEPPNPDAVNLLLDPGLAFGTGTHPTTALCLEWLDKTNLEGMHFIDYGCGSGILAIAALLLGAEAGWAVDNDPQALLATKDNAIKNKCLHSLEITEPGKLPDQPTDLILANILAGPLMELAPTFAKQLRPGGKLILSGILESQVQELGNIYQEWFKLEAPVIRDDWVRLEGTKK